MRTTETSFAPFGSATIALGHSENRTRISPTVSEIFDWKTAQNADISLFFLLLLAVRIHSNGYWFRSLVQVSIPKFWCWRRHISETIWTTETSFAPFGSATIALGHSENRTRISPTVSEIFDRKNSPERGYFFIIFLILIMPCELVRRHIRTCSSKFDVKMENLEILDVGDNNISETITTTETCVTPFCNVTLPVGYSKNETRISLTVSEIFDRKQEPWTRYFFIKSFANFRSERLVLFARVKWETSWCRRPQYLRNDNNYRDLGCTVL